jgi:long-chain acyl-CoA synthetase
MNPLQFLNQQMKVYALQEALIWQGQSYTYAWLAEAIMQWEVRLKQQDIPYGSVVTLFTDYSPSAIAILLALFNLGCIVVPLSPHMKPQMEECITITQSEFLIIIHAESQVEIHKKSNQSNHIYWDKLHAKNHPGLVLFSSGSTGKSKAVVHDALELLIKYIASKKQARVIGFLLFDHIGGLNTLFYTLFNGGCFIIVHKRDPRTVCEAIAKHQASALTTSPTFLTLMLVSEVYHQFNLNSLKVINYGTELMPESTLKKLQDTFPMTRLSQAYGLSEVGVLPIRSVSSDSLWFTLDQNICPYRIIDGSLELNIKTSLLGYLNSESPFTVDGWFKTGDIAELQGDRLKILGRKSEIINVGGEKVYPAEIESVIQAMPEVEQVVIGYRSSPLIGHIITATIKLTSSIAEDEFKIKLFEFCKSRLAGYKIPRKIILTDKVLYGERFKKIRKLEERI